MAMASFELVLYPLGLYTYILLKLVGNIGIEPMNIECRSISLATSLIPHLVA